IRQIPESLFKEIAEPRIQEYEQRAKLAGKLEGKQEGILEGKREGKLEGMLKGKLEGKLEGILEGQLAGEFKAKADDIIRFLTKRFEKSPPTNKLQEQIRDVRSIEKLDELFDFAITCNSIDEFVSAL
ncbi:MAG: hypothetical protein LBB88_00085, partial [Planctomycetaceae bacterium]|nr:hypothetical protein [Planctomycetaceae bacterium]